MRLDSTTTLESTLLDSDRRWGASDNRTTELVCDLLTLQKREFARQECVG